MIDNIVLNESANNKPLEVLYHEHISKEEAQWFATKLHELQKDRKSPDDLSLLHKGKYNSIDKKRGSCSECYARFGEAYYRRNT